MLKTMHELLINSDIVDLAIQFAILFVGELILLYWIFRLRLTEVVILSHVRLWIAVLLMSVINLSYYRLVIQIMPKIDIWIHIIYYVGVMLGTYPLVVLLEVVLIWIDAIGKGPIVKDLVRGEQSRYHANSGIIRRLAFPVLAGFLLVPGFMLVAPLGSNQESGVLVTWGIMLFLLGRYIARHT
jgi:hypothetical protein